MLTNVAYAGGKVSESVYKKFGVFWSRDAFAKEQQSVHAAIL